MPFDPAAADRQWPLDATLPALLPSFLMSQRWFAGKGRTIAAVRLVDHLWLPVGIDASVLAIVAVTYLEGDGERYCLWLGRRETPDALPVVGPDGAGEPRWIVEVAADPLAFPGLTRLFAESQALPTAGGGVVRFADVDAATAATLREAPPARALGSDQSNTSVRVGDRLVFKLFRRLQPGLNPEVEIGRFLTTRTAFDAFAALRGSIVHVGPDGALATIGVLQEWIDNVGDGWQYVQAHLQRRQDRRGSWPTAREALLGLGATTFAFHEALASDASSPEFAPEAVSRGDVDGWVAGVSACASQLAGRLLPEAGTHSWAAQVASVLGGLSRQTAALAPSIDGTGGFDLIRIHGDFHLGQTLKTPAGFVLVDFEGEPTRPIAERRRKHCALKDVAGMLRSFEYAVAVAGTPPGNAAEVGHADDLRSAFLEGYFAAASRATPAFLPAGDQLQRRWLRFFELDKALYELEYELDSRPAWAHIPALDILRLLDA